MKLPKITLPKIVLPKIKATWLIIGGLALALLIQRGCYNREINKKDIAISSLTLENQSLDSIKNKLGETVTTQEVIITNDQKSVKQLTDSLFKLNRKYEKKVKEVLFYASQKTTSKIDSVKVPYSDTIAEKHFSDSLSKACAEVINYYRDSSITVPRTVKLDTAGFRFSAVVSKGSFSLNTASFTDTQYIRVVEKKRNLGQFLTFKKRPIEIQVLHTSPFLTVRGQNSILYQPKKKANILLKAGEAAALIYLGTRL